MPTLIPDFARAMAESNRQAATSLNAEIRRIERLRLRVEQLRQVQADLETLRRRVAREARAATRDVAAEAQEIGELWSAAVQALRQGLAAEEQITVLQGFTELAGSGNDFGESARRLWAVVEQLGGQAEGVEELAAVGRLFDHVHAEASRALAARETPWQPSDPARLEHGLQEVREGRAVPPDEARTRFRKSTP